MIEGAKSCQSIIHNKAWPHTNIRTRKTIASFGWTTLPHPPYSPVLVPSDYHLFGVMKEGSRGKHYASDEKVKTAVWMDSKNRQQNFTRQTYMLSFEDETLLLRATVTMLRSRDVIHRRQASFWCMINVSILVIIAVLKKNPLLFDSPSYIYIYI